MRERDPYSNIVVIRFLGRCIVRWVRRSTGRNLELQIVARCLRTIHPTPRNGGGVVIAKTEAFRDAFYI